jgi:hypothetical protein
LSDLTYVPVEPPPRPFAGGDAVEVLDREGALLGERKVTYAGKRVIRTDCGRRWTPQGEFLMDNGLPCPFPSIRLVSA